MVEITTPEDTLYRFLDTEGDGTGAINAIGDYSREPTKFFFKAPRACLVYRLIVSVGSKYSMRAGRYGRGQELLNGWTMNIVDHKGEVLLDMTAGLPIRTNADIGAHCYDVDVKAWGRGDELLVARWTFTKAGNPLIVTNGSSLVVTLNDDFTGLNKHYFNLQGHYLP